MDEISSQIKQFILTDIGAELNISDIAEDEPLMESGIVDSLGVLKILGFLDESLGLDLSSEEVKLENFRTIVTIREMVKRQSGG